MSIKNVKKKRSGVLFKIFIFSIIFFTVTGGITGYLLWQKVFAPNVTTGHQEYKDFHIPTGSDICVVFDLLVESDLIRNRSTLEWLAKKRTIRTISNPAFTG